MLLEPFFRKGDVEVEDLFFISHLSIYIPTVHSNIRDSEASGRGQPSDIYRCISCKRRRNHYAKQWAKACAKSVVQRVSMPTASMKANTYLGKSKGLETRALGFRPFPPEGQKIGPKTYQNWYFWASWGSRDPSNESGHIFPSPGNPTTSPKMIK